MSDAKHDAAERMADAIDKIRHNCWSLDETAFNPYAYGVYADELLEAFAALDEYEERHSTSS